MSEYFLFGTDACHLCEEAELLLISMQIDFQFKDIFEQTDWQEKYSLKIPVLIHVKSHMQLEWPFDQLSLQDFFESVSA